MDNTPGMVLINRVVPGYVHRYVCLDNLNDVRIVARMLLSNGHQRIGYFSSNHGIEDDAMRKAGWMSALREQDIIPPESWIDTDTPDMSGGEAAIAELLGCNLQLIAVFVHNDNITASALTALKDNDIAIPLYLSITGLDNIPIARYTDL